MTIIKGLKLKIMNLTILSDLRVFRGTAGVWKQLNTHDSHTACLGVILSEMLSPVVTLHGSAV